MPNTTTSEPDTLILTVTPDGFPDAGVATVYNFLGTDPESGENIIFAVDHRVAQDIIDRASASGEALVEVEPWQILGKGAF